MKRTLSFAFSCLLLTLATGCPDYSHLRDVPDYENMTDAGDEIDEESHENDESN